MHSGPRGTRADRGPRGGRLQSRTFLDKKSCQWLNPRVLDVEVIEDRAAAISAMGTIRGRILSELSEPASAAALATRLGVPRQKVNYHLRALESHGLVRVATTRKWGGLTERLLVASASSYVVSPAALGPAAAEGAPVAEDALSSSYLVSLAARVVREVGELVRRASETGKRLPTLSIDTEIRFRSAEERAAFSRELAEAASALAARYHDESSPGGRAHRLVIVAHPVPRDPDTKEQPNVRKD
jgi:hypothetical protein